LLRIGALAALLALACLKGVAAPAQPSAELLAAGERLYREGRLASGDAVTALVQGDVPLRGTQVTCRNCHGRSGMGVIEGDSIAAAIAGPLLFAPDAQRGRPAYSEATLARALRDGIDPLGRPINPLMPRYLLGDLDIEALAAYLRKLGTVPSPGVGPDHLHLATVIAGDVDSAVEAAVLDVLERFVTDKNQSGPQRLRGGHFPKQWKETYREWSLDVWRLAGPPEGWRAQLEARYQRRPPFALVGGLASRSWQPIHDFCDSVRMPCLLPDIELPPEGDLGFYSLYFSRGLRQEAGIIAARLAGEGRHANVVSVVDGDRHSYGREAAAALAQALERRGGRMETLDAGDTRAIASRAASGSPLVLWLNGDAVRGVATKLGSTVPPLWLSSTMLEGRWDDLPAAVRAHAQVVHLTALAGEPDPALQRFRIWAQRRGLRIREARHQALAYFAGLTLSDGVKHTQQYVVRDYVMDMLEHASTLSIYLPLYRRAEFTPGQRILSRGGYVVDLSGQAAPVWLLP
jgi:mono/diheme cytochrome c family protein